MTRSATIYIIKRLALIMLLSLFFDACFKKIFQYVITSPSHYLREHANDPSLSVKVLLIQLKLLLILNGIYVVVIFYDIIKKNGNKLDKVVLYLLVLFVYFGCVFLTK